MPDTPSKDLTAEDELIQTAAESPRFPAVPKGRPARLAAAFLAQRNTTTPETLPQRAVTWRSTFEAADVVGHGDALAARG